MRVEIYQDNETMLLQKAQELKISPTQLVNLVLENVEIEPRMEVAKVKFVIEKKFLQKKPGADVRFNQNFATGWKE